MTEPGQIADVTRDVRLELADLLHTLDADQLATESLCRGWTVCTVAAHLVASATVPLPALMATVIRHGGSMRRASDRLARQTARRPALEIVELLRTNADRQLTSPRNGPVAPLTELLVHAGDIVRPLGVHHDPDAESARRALDLLVNVRPLSLVARGSLHGVCFVATDIDFCSVSGAEIHGRGADLMMAAAGRPSALETLAGPGVATLRSRLT